MGARDPGEIVVQEFFHMDGYAFYVWGSYAIVSAVLLLNVISIRLQRHKILRELAELSEEE